MFMGVSSCTGPTEVGELQDVMLEVDVVGAHGELQHLHSSVRQYLC